MAKTIKHINCLLCQATETFGRQKELATLGWRGCTYSRGFFDDDSMNVFHQQNIGLCPECQVKIAKRYIRNQSKVNR